MHRIRIGHGYDVHRLVENRKLILGGVEMPFLMLCWERLHWATSANIFRILTLAMLEQIACCF